MRTFFKRVGQLAPRAVPARLSASAVVGLGLGLSACTGVLGGTSGNQGNGPGGNTAGSSANGGGNATGGANGSNPDRGSPIQAAPTWRLTIGRASVEMPRPGS